MTINLRGTGMELTPAIRDYVEQKMSMLDKYFDNIIIANIDVGLRSNHHQKGDIYYAEVNLNVPGHLIRVVKEERDLYKAIDKVKDHLKMELEKMKEKMRRKDKKVLRDGKEYRAE